MRGDVSHTINLCNSWPIMLHNLFFVQHEILVKYFMQFVNETFRGAIAAPEIYVKQTCIDANVVKSDIEYETATPALQS